MNLININIHSAVDVITNSSTTIFTYSEGAHEAAEDVINEFLIMMSSDKKAKDIFYMDVFANIDGYCQYLDEGDEEDLPDELKGESSGWKETEQFVKDTVQAVLKKEIQRPKWMESADKYEDYDGMAYESTLYIMPKDKKYAKVAAALTKFLYSTDHEAIG